MTRGVLAGSALAVAVALAPVQSLAQQDFFLAQTIIFAGSACPNGWALMNGQVISIAQNTALFSLLGTRYGGNGQTTFALPLVNPLTTANGALLLQCIALQGIFPPPP